MVFKLTRRGGGRRQRPDLMDEQYAHHATRVSLQAAEARPETPSSSHARGRGIRHLAEHGEISLATGMVQAPYEWSPSTPPRPVYEPELTGTAGTAGNSSHRPFRAQPSGCSPSIPWAGQQSPRVRGVGILDTSAETWRSTSSKSQDPKDAKWKKPAVITVRDAAGITLTPGSLEVNPRTDPNTQFADGQRTAGVETSATFAATPFEGSPTRPRGLRAGAVPQPEADSAGKRSAAAATSYTPPAGGAPSRSPGIMWWHQEDATSSPPKGDRTSLL